MNYIYPDPLKKGDTIGLITPSSSLMPGRLEAGIHYFEQKGFKVKLERYNKCDRLLGGSDKDRANDIMTFFNDLKALLTSSYGSQHIFEL